MSQGAPIISAARAAYLAIIQNLRPAAVALLATSIGGILLGPAGVPAGGVAGAAIYQSSGAIGRAINVLLNLVAEYPRLSGLIATLIMQLLSFVVTRNSPEDNALMEN